MPLFVVIPNVLLLERLVFSKTDEEFVVTGTPFRAIVPAPLIDNELAAPALMAIDPAPVELMVAVLPAPGPLIVKAPPAPSILITEAPVAAMFAALPSNCNDGVLIFSALPDATVSVLPAATVIEAPTDWARKFTVPPAPAL